MKRPNSLRHLDAALRRLVGNDRFFEARTLIASAIVGQMLPDGVMKGGSALKMRYGDRNTRFTVDLDAARASESESYIGKLEQALSRGWEGFTGTIVPLKPPAPAGVPASRIMLPFNIKLSYLGRPWLTVPFELGHNEIGVAEHQEFFYPKDAASLLCALGFPELQQVPLISLSYQVAQKLHALSAKGSNRIRDLVDLQIIAESSDLDFEEIRQICEQLFSYRDMQAWPPEITPMDTWEEGYLTETKKIEGLRPFPEAVTWLKALIRRISAS